MRYRAIGFDMDGTLIDSVIDYEKLSMVEHDAFARLGVPDGTLKAGSEKEIILSGIEYLEKHGRSCTFEEISKIIIRMDNEIECENIEKSKLFPGTAELLESIKNRGLPIGLLTRGQRDYVTRSLKFCKIEEYFDAVDTYDDHPIGEQKPNPIAMEHLAEKLHVKANEILYIGDSATDYRCAKESKAGFIGIAFNARHREMWNRIDPEIATANDMEELQSIISNKLQN